VSAETKTNLELTNPRSKRQRDDKDTTTADVKELPRQKRRKNLLSEEQIGVSLA
jgi:hypothetical protein